MFDKFREECALMALWGHSEAANMVYLGLYAQQHRGQEGAGICAFDDKTEKVRSHRGLGLVADVFSGYDFADLPGTKAIGHVRYSTAGTESLINVQPFQAKVASGTVALAHNGNLVNAAQLRQELIDRGAIISSDSDSELFLHLISSEVKKTSLREALIHAMGQVKGAYSLLMLSDSKVFAARDPNGFRPLALGRIDDGWAIASETCAFDLIGAEYVRDVEPGEIVEISQNNELISHKPFEAVPQSPCIFEYIYFARPDSNVFGKNVYEVRKELGRELARECPADADIVMPVPDSGISAAIGFAEESGVPFELGLIRNHYVGRTFIEPKQSIRDFGVKIKHNANKGLLAGKKVCAIDDSIVRGTTTRKLIKMIRAAGAAQVHIRISAPPTVDPCFYGIDTPEKSKLIAARMSVAEICDYIGADSLEYLSMEGVYRAAKADVGTHCDACFSGNYPVQIGAR